MEQRLDEQFETILKLAFVAEFRDSDTSHHLRRVGLVAAAIARQLGCDDEFVAQLQLAAPMHDIGKVGIPDQILLKPSRLTDEERQVMQEHTILGSALLANSLSGMLQIGDSICSTHHERWDGQGYPHGLAGEAIPLAGRIVAVADVYDALTTRRVYKSACSPEEAAETLRADAGTHFDPAVVDAFFAAGDGIRAIYEEYGDEEEADGWVV